MMKILCIYPVDETTEFLKSIYEMLTGSEAFSCVSVENNVVQAIRGCDDDTTIIFLGHGASHCLYGRNRVPLIRNSDFEIFESKRIFLLACRSEEFITNNKATSPKEYIGFGNMPTEWEEIVAERDNDAFAYPNVDETIIQLYRGILADVISFTLSKTINLGKDFRYLYFLIKLLLNKHIVRLVKEEHTPQARALSKLLYDTKKDIIYKS